MAELGETSDPRALVPGVPAAIDENVVAVRGRGEALAEGGNGLSKIDASGWEGDAGEAFQEKFSYEPPKWLKAGDAFTGTAAALEEYVSMLRWAQGQAAEAIRLFQEGEQATRQAQADHDAAVAQADAQNRANVAAGNPMVVTVAAFHDPGEEKRSAPIPHRCAPFSVTGHSADSPRRGPPDHPSRIRDAHPIRIQRRFENGFRNPPQQPIRARQRQPISPGLVDQPLNIDAIQHLRTRRLNRLRHRDPFRRGTMPQLVGSPPRPQDR